MKDKYRYWLTCEGQDLDGPCKTEEEAKRLKEDYLEFPHTYRAEIKIERRVRDSGTTVWLPDDQDRYWDLKL